MDSTVASRSKALSSQGPRAFFFFERGDACLSPHHHLLAGGFESVIAASKFFLSSVIDPVKRPLLATKSPTSSNAGFD